MAARYNIAIEQNAEFFLQVTLRDHTQAIRDITSGGAQFEVRLEQDETSTLLYSATEVDYITVGGEDGTLYIRIPAHVIAAPPEAWTHGYYNLYFFPDALDRTFGPERVLEGRVKWSPAVADNPELPVE